MIGRDWLVFDDALRDDDVRPIFDAAVAAVHDGTASVVKISGESIRGFRVDGRMLLGTAVLRYGLGMGPASTFDAAHARVFTERMRALFGWHEISYTLKQWVEARLCTPYFVNRGSDWDEKWERRADADVNGIPDSFFDFACYVAIGELKHGPSYASVSADRIFGWVSDLGSDLPARLKKHGTGTLPRELAEFRGEGVTAKANDALAVIRITQKDESEQAYAQTLDHLTRLLTTTEFPRSYAIEFRGPTKTYLPVKGLPKKGAHQLFAAAAAYPGLHPAIEAYARAAMNEFEWYQNLDGEDCAMPGTFAVFALGLADAASAPLVLDYLALVDGEHQSMHGRFIGAVIDAHGFTSEALAYLIAAAGNIQHLRHRTAYPALAADRTVLETLLQLRASREGEVPSAIAMLRTNLVGDSTDDPGFRAARYAIWGEATEHDRGAGVIAGAPAELRPLYEQIFDDSRSTG
ncbi:DUF6138 family protein [Microbacterium sp. ZW T5_45]|uniref:DUF6138 family protein n=1 Tax=Microbacterium sp. ZW T5_45 TaxID=3378080 RepID=UPI0038542A4F